jgi:hypothetical protein
VLSCFSALVYNTRWLFCYPIWKCFPRVFFADVAVSCILAGDVVMTLEPIIPYIHNAETP